MYHSRTRSVSCCLASSGSTRASGIQWNALLHESRSHKVERELPRRVPRVFPLVGHRQDFAVVKVAPVMVAPVPALLGGRRLRRISAQPALDVVAVILLVPEEACDRLAKDPSFVVPEVARHDRFEKLVGLAPASLEDPIVV